MERTGKETHTHMRSQIADKEWLEGREAAELLTKMNGRPINTSIVRRYAIEGKVNWKKKPGYSRVNVYLRFDIEGLERIPPLRGSRTTKKPEDDTRTP